MNRLTRRSLSIVFLLSGFSVIGSAAEPITYDLRENLRNATVYIEIQLALASGDWSAMAPLFPEGQPRRPTVRASGSGFLITPDGYLITNAHVVDDVVYEVDFVAGGLRQRRQLPSDTRPTRFDPENPTLPFTLRYSVGSIKVVVRSGEDDERVYQPILLNVDRRVDLALLKLRGRERFDYLELNSADDVLAGKPVLMVGFPGGNLPDVALFADELNLDELNNRHPRVSINAGSVTSVREYRGTRRYQLDIRANHGNSGGPITDPRGGVVAVLYAGIDSMQSINYAIPVSELAAVLSESLRSSVALSPEDVDSPKGQSFDDFLDSVSFSISKDPSADKR